MNMVLKGIHRTILLGLVTVILLTDGRPRSTRARQSNTGFRVISNSSFPCHDLTSTTTMSSTSEVAKSTPFKPLQLTREEMAQSMQYMKVSYDTTLTAVSIEDAEYFPNILPLPESYKKEVKESLHHDTQGILRKTEILQYLEMVDNGTISSSDDNIHVVSKRDLSSTSHSDRSMSSDFSEQYYCSWRGEKTSDPNYLYMCSVCSITTDLGEHYSPRYINEAECHEFDNKCISAELDRLYRSKEKVNQTATNETDTSERKSESFHGKCQTLTLPLNILERQNDTCALALKDGQTVVVEDWKPVTKNIKVGCHCTVDMYSFFAMFV